LIAVVNWIKGSWFLNNAWE